MISDVIRVILADDHAVVRAGLKAVLGPAKDIQVVGEAANGRDAVAMAERLDADVVIMDLTMPEMDGVHCIGQLLREQPKLNILVVSALSDKSTAIAALKLGARGFVAKPFTDDELRMALLEVADVR